ncbi:hypothetical protein MLD38_027243 [Melastoma candidum]|uniref:Uncharacterized protein n=1 Tax=Melastoma candidum TaxID=119954 RepID=A0ACB9P0W6_9MYRT|nr:hypothetical protein MLD38_027243 [Melastoma candidum]
MEIACVEESGLRDEEPDRGTLSSSCSSSCRGYELARCTSGGLLTRKVDRELGPGRLRVVPKFAGRVLFLGRFPSFDCRIPRRVVSLDEQCLRQCLEWVLGKASKVMPFDAPLALMASATDGKSELRQRLAVKGASRWGSVNLNVDSAVATKSKSIGQIDPFRLQSSPLCTESANSESWTDGSSSLSSGRSSISAAEGSVSQGMLVFGWMDETPRFVFSPDDAQEVYIVDLTKVISSDRVDPDYKYSIRAAEHGKKERAIERGYYYHVGEINIAESISVCSDVLEVRTTEFVLFGGYKVPVEEDKGYRARKNKGLPSNAARGFTFKSRRTSKWRSMPCRSGISEDISTELRMDKVVDLESHRHPGNEVAAIVVKCCAKDNAAKRKLVSDGWGMKFLKKIQSASITQHSEGFLESMNVVIPAGLHGGPRTALGGPSSLLDRFNSGGKCDCGGWDLGCPLTLLKARSTEAVGNLRSVDLVMGGSNPTLRMTNIRDGLFLIRFNRSLSALQALCVGVAYIHTHDPLVQQRLHRELSVRL